METNVDIVPPQQKDEATTNQDPESQASENQTAMLQTRLADEVRLRQFTEDVLDSRQQELESQEMQNQQLSKDLEAIRKELSDTQSQLAEARGQVRAKTKHLQDAKDQIFRLQPQRKDITESEAQDYYRNLCGNVQRWVENRLKPMLDDLDLGRLRTRPGPIQATRFVSLLREPSKRCINIDESDEHHVIAVIMNYLWLAFFAKSFYCPLDDTDADATVMWIDELESTMSRLSRGECYDTQSLIVC